MKILIVEDDPRIANPLAKDLRHQNYSVDIAQDGLEGWDYAQATDYDLILLDLMLPRLDGVSLCKRLRATQCPALILMLTARDTTSDKVIGLDAGADDYLIKPFKLDELAARIRALQRRSRELTPTTLHYGLLRLDPASRIVTYNCTVLSLTPKEYLLLEHFLRHPKQVLSRSALLDKLWEFDQASGEGTIKTHLTNLRSKLRVAGSPQDLIETVYGMGYRLASLNP
ncbi:response regulator transcription factor [Synechocystis sp. LEGE 06083]|jgi:DNA-binding response OmpR family regulator|uniref:response regulator transcription factor n=1 Tax=Synechocystis sp. LEGE 06083 TaxID=915336 RepID=UPI0018822046|nr:response regulator transcription factor [Synechocystis sp. LEGE 06083]MBE9193970.1 response regulator transcription factor [Synechocystis sp. LEGE 06083]